MRHMQSLFVTYLLSVINHSLIEVCSWPVQTNSFDDRIKRVLQAEAFFFLQSKQYIVLYLIEKS